MDLRNIISESTNRREDPKKIKCQDDGLGKSCGGYPNLYLVIYVYI